MGKASRQKKDRDAPTREERSAPSRAQSRIELTGPQPPTWLHPIVIASLMAIALLVYSPSLTGEFVFDDHNAIQQSLLVRDLFPLTRFLTHSNRPLVDFSFAVNYALGGYETWWFHYTNILFHIAVSIALYALALRTFRLPIFAERYSQWSQPMAWMAAAVFLTHPLASEAVSYVSCRSELMVALFYLATLVLYSLATTANSAATRRGAKYAIPITAGLALGSKEIAVTIPFALFLYDFVFHAECEAHRTKGRLGTILYSLIPLVLGGAYFAVRAFASGVTTPYQQSAGFGFDRYTPIEYLSTQFGVLLHYLRLCILPTGLNFDYDWPLTRSLFSLDAVLPMIALVVLAALAIRFRKQRPFFFFGMCFFVLVLAPTSSIMPVADVAVERRMYIPLVGFALFAVALGADVARQQLGQKGLAALAVTTLLVVAVASTASHARATQWGDHLVLYEDAILKSPGSPRVRLNLGVIHLNAGRHEEAHDVLFEAKRIFDKGESIHAFDRIGAFIYYNLGAIQFIRQEFDESELYMREAIRIGGQYVALRPRAYAVLGHIFRTRKQWDAAEEAFREALRFNRDYPEWMLALMSVLIDKGDTKEAGKISMRLNSVHPQMKDSPQVKALRQRLRNAIRENSRKKSAQKREPAS